MSFEFEFEFDCPGTFPAEQWSPPTNYISYVEEYQVLETRWTSLWDWVLKMPIVCISFDWSVSQLSPWGHVFAGKKVQKKIRKNQQRKSRP